MKFIIIILVLFFTVPLLAQPEIAWVRTYGGDGSEHGNAFVITVDNGFAIAGALGNSFWLVRINEEGEEIWTESYDVEDNNNVCHDLVQTEDGGFLLVGGMSADDFHWLVIRINNEGEEIWRRVYLEAGRGRNIAESVVALKDDQFVIAGGLDPNEGQNDGYVMQIDGDGDIIWEQEYGDDDNQHFRDIIIAPGGYAMCGYTGADGDDFWLVRINEEGQLIWQQNYGNDQWQEFGQALLRPRNGGFAVVGYVARNDEIEFMLVLANDEGQQEWLNIYEFDQVNRGFAIAQQIDGGYTLAGAMITDFPQFGQALNTDAAGNLTWDFVAGEGSIFTEFNDVKIYPQDNSTILCGETFVREGGVQNQAMLIKMEPVNHPPEIIFQLPPSPAYALVGAGNAFSVEVVDVDGDELSYFWVFEEDTIGNEDMMIINFEEEGEFQLEVFVSDGEFSDSANWEIRAIQNLIGDFSPEETEFAVQQGHRQLFEISPSLDPDSVSIIWILNEDTTSVTPRFIHDFDSIGQDTVRSTIQYHNLIESIEWFVTVIPQLIVDHSPPDSSEIIIYRNEHQRFSITTGLHQDSLDIRWVLSNEYIDDSTEVDIEFLDTGRDTLHVYVSYGGAQDSIVWYINVLDNEGVNQLGELKYEIEFTLNPYPNPFNSTTSLIFNIPFNDHVFLKVFNVNGIKISTLMNEYKVSGTYTLLWNADFLQSGLYFAVIESRSLRRIRKMIVIK